MRKALSILLLPPVLALFVAIPVILILPLDISRYHLEIQTKSPSSYTEATFFHDFDHDGIPERVWLTIPGNRMMTTLLVYDNNNETYHQWELPGPVFGNEFIDFFDVDNDSVDELILVTGYADTAYLNCINPISHKIYCDNIEITDFGRANGGWVSTQQIDHADFDGDGIEDILVLIGATSSEYANRLFKYDLTKETLDASPDICASIANACVVRNPGGVEILLWTFSSNECNDKAYPDHSCWMMILDGSLQFKYDPQKITAGPYATFSLIYNHSLNRYIGMLSAAIQDTMNSWIAYFDDTGGQIPGTRKRIGGLPGTTLLSSQGSAIAIISPDSLKMLDTGFNRESVYPVNGYGSRLRNIDLFPEKESSFIYPDYAKGSFDLFLEELRIRVSSRRVEISPSAKFFVSTYSDNDGSPYFFVDTTPYSYLLKLEHDPRYALNYLFYPAIYAGSLIVIYLLLLIVRFRIQQKFKHEKELHELQLKSARNQLESHFTLNLMETLSNMVETDRRKEAISLFSKFTRLLRDTLQSFDRFNIPLNEEIEYNSNYLSLQETRLSGKLTFEIDTDHAVPLDTLIPKMLIHTFVENAIKHGIRHLSGPGHVRIRVESCNNEIKIEIIDNGIGRAEARKLGKQSTGKGLHILDQTMENYRKEFKRRIRYTIKDLSDPSGTYVEIIIPLV